MIYCCTRFDVQTWYEPGVVWWLQYDSIKAAQAKEQTPEWPGAGRKATTAQRIGLINTGNRQG